MTETWRAVPGFTGYEVSDLGLVRSTIANYGNTRTEPLLLKPEAGHRGHLRVTLCRNGKRQRVYVHHLVLEAFVGPCPDGQECRHLNDTADDNRLENLTWGTRVEQQADAKRNGRRPAPKLSPTQVAEARERIAAGESMRSIGRAFGVHGVTVARAVS